MSELYLIEKEGVLAINVELEITILMSHSDALHWRNLSCMTIKEDHSKDELILFLLVFSEFVVRRVMKERRRSAVWNKSMKDLFIYYCHRYFIGNHPSGWIKLTLRSHSCEYIGTFYIMIMILVQAGQVKREGDRIIMWRALSHAGDGFCMSIRPWREEIPLAQKIIQYIIFY